MSSNVYSEIVNWLKSDNSVTIQEHLTTTKGLSENEVKKFLNEYFAGAKTKPNNDLMLGKSTDVQGPQHTEFTFCDCKNVIPSEVYAHKFEQAPYLLENEFCERGEIAAIGRMAVSNAHWALGVATSFAHSMSFDDTECNHASMFSGHEYFEILYLCTQKGLRSNNCNCDKEVELVGEYELSMDSEIVPTFNSSEIHSLFRHGIFGAAYDRDVFNFKPNSLVSTDEFLHQVYETGNRVEKDFWGVWNATPYNWQNEYASSPYGYIHDEAFNVGTDLASVLPSFVYNTYANILWDETGAMENRNNFMKNHGNTIGTTNNDYGDFHFTDNAMSVYTLDDEIIQIEKKILLRSNIPKIFVFINSTYSHYYVNGNEGYSNHYLKTNLWYTLKLPEQTDGWNNSIGEPEVIHSEECCNDDFALFSYSVLGDNDREYDIGFSIIDAMNNDVTLSNGYTHSFNYRYGIGCIVSGGDFRNLEADKGFAYDLRNCGNCNDFDIQTNSNELPVLWQPIVEVTGDPCSGTVQAGIVNLINSQMPVTKGNLKIRIFDDSGNNVNWNLTSNIATQGLSNQSNSAVGYESFDVNIVPPNPNQTEPRIHYKIELESPEGCVVLAVFAMPTCTDAGLQDCLKSKFEFLNNTDDSPEPGDGVTINWGELDLCSFWGDINSGGYNANHFRIEVYSMQGVNIFTSPPYGPNDATGTLHIPSAAFPVIPANYVIRVVFQNHTYITELVTIQ